MSYYPYNVSWQLGMLIAHNSMCLKIVLLINRYKGLKNEKTIFYLSNTA